MKQYVYETGNQTGNQRFRQEHALKQSIEERAQIIIPDPQREKQHGSWSWGAAVRNIKRAIQKKTNFVKKGHLPTYLYRVLECTYCLPQKEIERWRLHFNLLDRILKGRRRCGENIAEIVTGVI